MKRADAITHFNQIGDLIIKIMVKFFLLFDNWKSRLWPGLVQECWELSITLILLCFGVSKLKTTAYLLKETVWWNDSEGQSCKWSKHKQNYRVSGELSVISSTCIQNCTPFVYWHLHIKMFMYGNFGTVNSYREKIWTYIVWSICVIYISSVDTSLAVAA